MPRRPLSAAARSPALPWSHTAQQQAAKRLHALGQQAGGESGEDVAAAALGHAVVTGGVHRQTAVRRGHHRAAALQHQIDAAAGRIGRRPALPSAAEVAAGTEKLPLVGRHHRHLTAAEGQLIYMPLQRVYAIGIQYQRLVQRQQAAHQRIALLGRVPCRSP